MSVFVHAVPPAPAPLTTPMPMSSQPTKRPAVANTAGAGANTTTFEFTRRKKWTDILLSELPDTVVFILDVQRIIQYATPGACETLGWAVDEMVNVDVLDFINNNDKEAFTRRFEDSFTLRQELFCYSRLKSKLFLTSAASVDQSPAPVYKELLFEIKGHALCLPEHVECLYFFFVAKPYPSRNMAILNTFLECKIENERLKTRLADLKADMRLHRISAASSSSTLNSIASGTMPTVLTHVFGLGEESGTMSPTIMSASDFAIKDEDEEGGRKKKLKKTPLDGQHVCFTCGRTDSPEWRKGPKGPKTLCNACGLRWAKRARTKSEDGAAASLSPAVHGQVVDGASLAGQWHSPYTYVGTPRSTSAASSKMGRMEPVANAALSVTPVSARSASVEGAQHQHQQHQHQQHHRQQHMDALQQQQQNQHVYGHGRGQGYEQGHAQSQGQHHPGMGLGMGVGAGMHVPTPTSAPSSAQVSPVQGQGPQDFGYGVYAPGGGGGGYLAAVGSPVATLMSVNTQGLHHQQQQQQQRQLYSESPNSAGAGYAYHDEGYAHAQALATQWNSRVVHPQAGQQQQQHQHQQRGAYPGY